MCGIYGTTLKYDKKTLNTKLELIKFRGPDHTGLKTYTATSDVQVTLGHVRLSIIDLDARSNQPFEYNDNLSIVFNGEIYNYRELKTRFLGDVTFRTESDTEVICAMYERFGSDCVKYFNGMFAYVIFDKKKNILIGARDRLGKKPFYYWLSDEGFEFSSQLKSILYGNNFNIDDLARKFYLLQGVIPDPYTPLQEIKKLRAGQCFTYDLTTHGFHIQQYWDIHTNSCGYLPPKSYEEAKETIRELLYDSIRLRLNANVPVGTFLSGGIDSSLVCAIVSDFNKDLCAYTAQYENKSFDESDFAATTAKHLNIPIKRCECSGQNLLNIFHDYLDYFDEPYADDSLIPSALVAQEARKDVTVILGGDGGDELFYGYSKYEWTRNRLLQYKKPYWFRKLATPYFRYKGGAHEVFQATQRNYSDVYRSLGMFCYTMNGAELFDRLEIARMQPDGEYLENEKRGILAYSDYDMKTFMNAVNMKVDRATMRCSMELRSPLMDYRIAEYSRLLPYEYMFGGGLGKKRILKDILFEKIPRKMLERPKKGFVPPAKDWFRNELRQEMTDICSATNVSRILPEVNADRFLRLRDSFLSGENDNIRMIFSIYSYIKWFFHYASSHK